MNKLTRDVRRYAQLLQSVGRQGKGSNQNRPLSPVECAKAIQQLIDEEGDSLSTIATRLGIGQPKDTSNIYKKRDTTQVTSFLNLLKVSEKSRSFAGWGYEGYPTIPFSTIAILSTMTPHEQDLIIQSIYNTKDKTKSLGKEDAKKIRKWRNENPDIPINYFIEKILKLKPVTNITYIVVSEIQEKLKQFISSNEDYREKLLNILKNAIDGEFYSIDATDIIITISMNEKAYRTFHDHQYKQKISFTQFLNSFLEDKIG